MRFIHLIFFQLLIVFFLRFSNADNEQNLSKFVLKEMKEQIVQLKTKQNAMKNVINECKRIFLELITVDGVNITMDFLNKEMDPFGFGIISKMEFQIKILSHTIETKPQNNNQYDLELYKAKNNFEAKLDDINKLIRQTGDDLKDLKNEVHETVTSTDLIKYSQGDILTRVENINGIHKKQESLSEDILNLINTVKGNSFQFNEIIDSLEQKHEKVTKLLQNVVPKSCDDIIESGLGAGMYTLFTAAGQIEVFCDNFGKMLIQKQMKGPIDFDRNWIDYKNGFGSPLGQYWIGLDNLHILTSSKHYELFFYIMDFDNVQNYARYDHFIIGSETEEYEIKKLGAYNRNTTHDQLRNHLNMKFTTRDRNNNPGDGENCAVTYKCGWWYKNCSSINLNQVVGKRDYKPENPTQWKILHWSVKPLKEASMYIKLHN